MTTMKPSPLRPPVEVGDIDGAWLTDALQQRHPGAVVCRVEVISSSQLTNAHAIISVTYEIDVGAPTSMFCKLLPRGDRRDAIAATLMGPNEVRFYRDLAPRLQFRVPALHVGFHDSDDNSFILLLENLHASGCQMTNGTRGIRADEAAHALEALAHMHARYEDPRIRAEEAPWVHEPVPGGTYGTAMLQYGLDHHRHRLSDAFAAIAQLCINNAPALRELWTDGPKTIIHGDPHNGNLFFDGATVGFLDWGIININTPMRDVSYFMNMAMDIDERRAHQGSLLRLYLDVRESLAATVIPFDDAWRSHRIHTAYCVLASCQVVTFPERASSDRRVQADAFLQRAEAAIEDLDALGALQVAGLRWSTK
jgi:hypothetical protein